MLDVHRETIRWAARLLAFARGGTLVSAFWVALSACSGAGPTDARTDDGDQALVLPRQPLKSFLLPGIVGHTGFGVPTPVGISTIAGANPGNTVSLANLINTSGAYEPSFAMTIPSGTSRLCFSASSVCLSAHGTSSVTLVSLTDPNGDGFVHKAGTIQSSATGLCIHASGLGAGGSLRWMSTSPIANCTLFLGVGFQLDPIPIEGTSKVVGIGISGHGLTRLAPMVAGAWPPGNYWTVSMDAAFYGVIGANFAHDSAGNPEYALLTSAFGPFFSSVSQPVLCAAGSTTTTASMYFAPSGPIGVCNGRSWGLGVLDLQYR